MLGALGRHIRKQFVGYVALFIALGGVSYAAMRIPPNSVTSAQIKDAQVKTADLGDSSVTASKIKRGSLVARLFRPGQLPAGPRGSPGPSGPPGATGPKGDTGPASATKLTVRYEDTVTPTGADGSHTTLCGTGERASGGGVELVSGMSVNQWYYQPGGVPFPSGTPAPLGWRASWYNASGGTNTIRVYVVCASS